LVGRIGPHEGRELALLKSGEKRVAWFPDIAWAPEADAAPLVAAGVIVREVWAGHSAPSVVYYLPGAEADVAELKRLTVDWLGSGVGADVADERVGQILGYSADDIAAFLANKARIMAEPKMMRLAEKVAAFKNSRQTPPEAAD
jgi:hypothetical protein